MKPLRRRLEDQQKKTNLRLEVLQQDYLLSWVLAGLFEEPSLKNVLIFKGGTALKKCYFGKYRFSEDLDFTALPQLPEGNSLLNIISSVCENIESKMNQYAPVRLQMARYEERKPHPHGQEAFKIRAQFPWQREPLTTVMVEISRDEILSFPPTIRKILHDYGESIDQKVPTYSLEEIVLEKLRAILQHTKKLHERDWSRSRARDYYDLWRIFSSFGEELYFINFGSALKEKCTAKEVSFDDVEAFFDPLMIRSVLQTWEKWLGPLVPDLPKSEQVLDELKEKLDELLLGVTIQSNS